jgi:phosphohistidine phosphatase
MGKKLYIVRHAKSDWNQGVKLDFDRPLNERGLRNAPFMADQFVERGLSADFILSSPANRALSTALIFKRRLGLSDQQFDTERRIYEADAKRLLDIICRLDNRYESVMIFGHNPGVSALVNLLTDELVMMSTCAIAEIEVPLDDWSMVSESTSNLLSFDFPKRYV